MIYQIKNAIGNFKFESMLTKLGVGISILYLISMTEFYFCRVSLTTLECLNFESNKTYLWGQNNQNLSIRSVNDLFQEKIFFFHRNLK